MKRVGDTFKKTLMHCLLIQCAPTNATVLARPPAQDPWRHGCRQGADRDVLAACPAMVGGQGPRRKHATSSAQRARLTRRWHMPHRATAARPIAEQRRCQPLLLACRFAGVASGAELRILAPVRPLTRVGQLLAQRIQHAQIACGAGEGPVRLPFVALLVIALGGVVVGRSLACRHAAHFPILAGCIPQRRHAALGEGKMIGAEEIAGLRLGIGRIAQLELRGDALQLVEQFEFCGAIDAEIARRHERIHAVHVDHRHCGIQRVQRLGRVELRAQQALFFGGDGQEHHRALGLWPLGETARQLQQRGGAAGVFQRTVEDGVAARIRLADADVVPVRAVDQRLVRMLAAFQPRHDVVRRDQVGLDLIAGAQTLVLEFDRLEAARLRLLLQGLEIQPGMLEQLGGQIALDPAFQRRMRAARVIAYHIEHGVGVGVGHRVPAVRGRRGFVHDQHAECALARAFFVLVGPTAVVGHADTVEIPLAGFKVRVVDQHHGDLALQIHTLEVVPVALRRLDAVADEHQRRVGDLHVGGAVQRGADDNLLALGQRLRLAGVLHGNGGRADDIGAQQRHGLGPGALAAGQIAARLQAGLGELLAQVGNGLLFASGRRAAAFIGVGGQFLDVARDTRAIETRCRRHQCGRDRHRQKSYANSLHCTPRIMDSPGV
ncbi:hypothetical protein XOO4014 [Xanthomonas oryzae pv. oryzae KACC 10331]|uniref:Uncharacterized protein n=1 Tax=Xanthomonas oryzae pv. oryzae (strain KACC10331 / KXO85) TaxID=291331 RepID=Q5GVK5_XANOR|nr:hypothetical protein XOO4014 [Xanthomonas oryzae pv. oryzae KACC 10331]